MLRLKAEITRQAAAAGIEDGGTDLERLEKLKIGVESQIGMLVAVHLRECRRHAR